MTDSRTAEGGSTIVLAAVCVAALMLPLSFTGPSVASPAIAAELGGTTASTVWLMNGFMLAFGSTVMAAGALADQIGRKRVFRLGVTLFALLSLVIGFAPDMLTLNLLRAGQGVVAALALAGGSAALAQEFEGPARARAYSLLGTSFGVGLAFGPLWDGYLVETFGWRSVFLSSAVIGLLVLVFGVPRMRETRDPGATGIDRWGTSTFTATLLLLTFAIVEGPARGWGDPTVLALFAGAALMLAAFIMVETRQARPMLDLSLFRYKRFIAVQALPVATAYGFVVPVVLLPARFVGIEGMSEVEVGLMMLPLCAPMAIVPFIGGLLARWVPAGHLSAGGFVLTAAGLFWLSTVPPGSGAWALGLPMAAIGIGTGLPWGLMDNLAISVVPKERAGMATGIFATMRVAGESVALAVVGAILAGLTRHGLAAGGSDQVAAANELAGGNIVHAASLLPLVDLGRLADIYGDAFSVMLQILGTITLLAAIAAFFALRNAHKAQRAAAVDACEAAASPYSSMRTTA